MKAKEYIIQKLVQTGKKHRWLKYPMLALVSLISFFFLLIEKCMERPKRAAIVMVCLVLIISQSWYLISRAADGSDQPEGGNPVSDTQIVADPQTDPDESTPVVNYSVIYESAYGTAPASRSYTEAQFGEVLKAQPTGIPANYKWMGWKIAGTDDSAVLSSVTKEDFGTSLSLRLVGVCERESYTITYTPGSVSSGDTVVGEEKTETVAVVKDGTTQVTLKTAGEIGYSCKGYTFTNWKVQGTGERITVGGTYSFGNEDITVTPDWIPNQYTIAFDVNGGDPADVPMSYSATYGTAVTLPICTYTKDGYSFVGWATEANGDVVYRNGATIADALTDVNGATVTLYAKWEYKIASVDASSIVAEYGDAVHSTIHIYRDSVDESGENFKAELIGISGTTTDGAITTASGMTDLTGVTVTTGTNVIQFDTQGTRVKTVSDGEITLTFNIEDKNHPEAGVVTAKISVTLNKKTITVTGAQNTAKPYDGTTSIPLGSFRYQAEYAGGEILENTAIQGVIVNNATQTGDFSDPNAGENKTITISNIYLSGDNAKYFTVSPTATVSGGSIEKRQAYVSTAPVYAEGKDYILSGQTPAFVVEVDTADLAKKVADPEADAATIVKGIAPSCFQCSYVSEGYKPGTYDINLDIRNVQLTNFVLQVTNIGQLKVKQDSVDNNDYIIKGNQSADGWYYGMLPTVSASKTGYDSVCVVTSVSDAKGTYDAASFQSGFQISEELASGDMYVQLADSSTGAVTGVKKLDIKVDVTAPIVNGDITIASVKNTPLQKIGHFLSFGNFFKEELQVTVPVADVTSQTVEKVSGVDSLIYYLGGDISDEATAQAATLSSDRTTATFKIPMGFDGEIAFVMKDKAGNTSSRVLVYVESDGTNGSKIWVVEDTAPELTLEAKDAEDGLVYSGEGYYYRNVTVSATATDSDAGVAYILWTVTKDGETLTEKERQDVTSTANRVETETFTKTFNESGAYTVTAIAYDNAENESEVQTIDFVVDGTAPVITVTPENYDEEWATEKTITFKAEDSESGIDMLSLRDADGNAYPYVMAKGEKDAYTFTTSVKGDYTIKVLDRAGNAATLVVSLTKVSAEVPENPVVSVSPEMPEDVDQPETYWYAQNPTIEIQEPETTPDGTKITAYYHMWQAGTSEPTYENNRAVSTFRLPDEGVWNLRVWAETESGVRNEYASEEDGLYQIRYDGTKPVITDVVISGSGTSSRVSFKIEDTVSGLANALAIYDNKEENAQALTLKEAGDGTYTGSFMATMKGTYVVRAIDRAGNVSEIDAFEPMSIRVTGVTGDADKGMTIAGLVTEGTYELDHVAVYYGVSGQELQEVTDVALVENEDGSYGFTSKCTGLQKDNRYKFQITAYAKSGESCTHTGEFKTEQADVTGTNIAGTVADETMGAEDTAKISVILYEGTSIIQTYSANNHGTFYFTDVPDGTYTIKAVNGNRSTSQAVVIAKGAVIEPSTSIQLVLRNGQMTDVEYKDAETPKLIISGLDGIFEDTTNFGSDADNALIHAGGTVEFCLKVAGLSEDQVPGDDLAGIRNNMKRGEAVAMYLDLSLWKRSTGAYGVISETQITAINGGKTVRIVIPLTEELASKKELCVIRVHDGSVERLADLDANPYTYTIESSLFSTYALVYSDGTQGSDDTTAATSTSGGGSHGSTSDATTAGTGNGSATVDISKRTNGGVVTSGKNGGSPSTGDTTPILWVTLGMLLTAGAGVLLLKNKKR